MSRITSGLLVLSLAAAAAADDKPKARASPAERLAAIQKELKGTKFEPLRETPNGIQTSYVEPIAPGGAMKTVVSYVARGASLYKFFLTYAAGNRSEAAFTSAFEKVIQEAQLR